MPTYTYNYQESKLKHSEETVVSISTAKNVFLIEITYNVTAQKPYVTYSQEEFFKEISNFISQFLKETWIYIIYMEGVKVY